MIDGGFNSFAYELPELPYVQADLGLHLTKTPTMIYDVVLVLSGCCDYTTIAWRDWIYRVGPTNTKPLKTVRIEVPCGVLEGWLCSGTILLGKSHVPIATNFLILYQQHVNQLSCLGRALDSQYCIVIDAPKGKVFLS